MASKVGPKLGLVVDLIPHHRVGFAGCVRCPNGEDESAFPCNYQELQDLCKGQEVKTPFETDVKLDRNTDPPGGPYSTPLLMDRFC